MADDTGNVPQLSVMLTMLASRRRRRARDRPMETLTYVTGDSMTGIMENMRRRRRLFFERQAAERRAFFNFILTLVGVCSPTPERILWTRER